MYIKTSNQEKVDLGFGGYSCNWGLHIAALYATEKERDDILFGFLHQGAEDGDLQLYCFCEMTQDIFETKFSKQYPCCAAKTKNKDVFKFVSAKDCYYPAGKFSLEDIERNLNSFYSQSQKNGKRNLRTIGAMSWALEAVQGKENLLAYESRLNYFISGKPWIGLCMYDLRKFSGDIIMGVLRTHPYTISGRVITENPYYVNPDIYLAKHAPKFLKK
ncbi:MAG: MEDS domain-containing protein [Candidatus Omnitrophota bacterium]